jgi:hypothetical protein
MPNKSRKLLSAQAQHKEKHCIHYSTGIWVVGIAATVPHSQAQKSRQQGQNTESIASNTITGIHTAAQSSAIGERSAHIYVLHATAANPQRLAKSDNPR